MKTFEPPSLTPVRPEGNAEITFLITANAGVWTVTKDGNFYGDYLKEEHARASAQCAVAAILEKGGAAKACLIPASAPGAAMLEVPVALEVVACERPSPHLVPEAS